MFAHIAANGSKRLARRHFCLEPTRLATFRRRCITPFLDAILNRGHPRLVPVLSAGLDAARGIGVNDRNSFKAGQNLYFSVFCSMAAGGAILA